MTISKPHVLFVDDEAKYREVMTEGLQERGFEVSEAEDGEKALELLDEFAFDLLITDLRLPGIDGARVVEAAIERQPGIVAIVITGYGTVKDAVDAIKRGASDFVAKGVTFNELIHRLEKAIERQRLTFDNDHLRRENHELKLEMESKHEMVGKSAPMRAVLKSIRLAAPTNATVMLFGESGVGKELVARTIHGNSPRADQRFVQVNCAAIPEELIESELFGHEKGSFTGASDKQIGKFEQADLGTIFLDEVGDMSPKTQAKVLRVLAEQEVERLGSVRTIKVDVRVIAATNKKLDEAIQRGEFREDLYFRLKVIPVVVPPLRERSDDIGLLVQHFTKRISEEHNIRPKRFDARAIETFRRYRWPGNIRELRNIVERLMIMTSGETVRPEDLPPEVQGMPPEMPAPFVELPEEGLDLPRHLASVERDLVHRALDRTRGNRNKAADLLRIKRTTLVEKLRRIGADH